MKQRFWVGLMALVVSGVGLAKIDTSDIDTDVMRAMDDAIKDFEPSLGANNVDAAKNDIAILLEGYDWTANYFKAKGGAPDAEGWAATGRQLIADAQAAVARNDLTKAAELARQTTRNCKSCHDVYKTTIAR